MSYKLFSLIDSIIDELVNQDSSLENALLKTQVLAFKLKNDKLKIWVNNELNGYNKQDEIPEFRIVNTQVKGNLFQGLGYGGYQQLTDTVLPIEYLDNKELGSLSKHKFLVRISEIQDLSKSKNGLIAELPYSFLVMMSKRMSPWEVIKAWKVISTSSLVGILSTIKSKLINFLLELKEELGDENIPIMQKKKEIDNLIDKTIGEINAQNVNISIENRNIQIANSGAENQFQLTSGNNADQKIGTLDIKDVLKFIKDNINELGVNEILQEEILIEVNRGESQLKKSNPKTQILLQSLNVVYDILVGVAGNAYTDKVLYWISQLGKIIA